MYTLHFEKRDFVTVIVPDHYGLYRFSIHISTLEHKPCRPPGNFVYVVKLKKSKRKESIYIVAWYYFLNKTNTTAKDLIFLKAQPPVKVQAGSGIYSSSYFLASTIFFRSWMIKDKAETFCSNLEFFALWSLTCFLHVVRWSFTTSKRRFRVLGDSATK